MSMGTIPHIDPRVKYVGVSKLRELNSSRLKEQNDETLVIQENNEPLAVLVSYEQYLIMQEQLHSVINTLEVITDEMERKGLLAGLDDLRSGRVQSLAEIEAELERK